MSRPHSASFLFFVCAAGVFWAARSMLGSTYYVAPSGDDANPGSAEKPFRTIQKAAKLAQPGDTVLIQAGTYAESVIIENSGAHGKPIIFQGERGPKGEWLTIVDRSIPAGPWTPAPEVGRGVFKAKLPFPAYSMTLDDKQLARINDKLMQDKKGFEFLGYPADATVKMEYANEKVSFWDGVEVIYGVHEGVTYIRFRNGDDPNGKNLKAAPEGAGFLLDGKSYIILRDLRIRGAQDSIVIRGKGASHNVVERCYLTNGHNRVVITDGASHNIVRANEMTLDYYAFQDPGAWGTPNPTPHTRTRLRIYRVFKLIVGPGSSDDHGVWVRNAGEGNEVCQNHIFNGLIGVSCGASRGLKVHHNVIHNMSSVGILTSEDTSKGAVDLECHDNLIYDCNINLRIHHYNNCLPGERREYHYRNLFYQKPNLGSHIFVHLMDKQMRPGMEHPEIFIYHNTFVGGEKAIVPSGWAVDAGGLARTVVLNNVISSPISFYTSKVFVSEKSMMGAFDYNWLGGRFHHGTAVWLGEHNIKADGQFLWSGEKMPDFKLPENCAALACGLDLSKPFTLGDKTYGPLPGMKKGYFSGAAPDLGALQRGESVSGLVAEFIRGKK